MVSFLCGGVGHRLIISRCQPFKGSGCFTHLEQRLHPGPGSCVLTGDSMSSLGPGCSGQDLSHLPPTPLSQRLSGSLLRSWNDSLLLPSLCPKPAAQPTAHQLLCLQRHSWLSLASSSRSLHAEGPLIRGPTPRRAAPLSLASPHPGSAADPLLHFKKQNYVLIK